MRMIAWLTGALALQLGAGEALATTRYPASSPTAVERGNGPDGSMLIAKSKKKKSKPKGKPKGKPESKHEAKNDKSDGKGVSESVSKSTVPAKLEPVKVRTTSMQTGLKKGSSKKTLYMIQPGKPLEIDAEGAGELVLQLHQVMGKKSATAKVLVKVDGVASTVTIAPKSYKGYKLTHSSSASPSKPEVFSKKLASGSHTLSAITTHTDGVAAEIIFKREGSKEIVPVIVEPRPAAPPSPVVAAAEAAAAEAPSEFEPEIPIPGAPELVAPPTPGAPEAEVAAAEPAAEAAPAVVVEATPAEPVVEAPPPEKTPEERFAAGEVRDALRGTYPTLTVSHTSRPESHDLFKLDEEQSFSFMVAGPGEVTVRLHRLLDPLAPPETEATSNLVILENDVVLQQATGERRRTELWAINPGSEVGAGLALSEPKEYHLKVANKKATFVFQISGSPKGMALNYSFAAETSTLSSLATLRLDDEEDDGEGDLGLSAMTATPTVITEVDIRETITKVGEESKPFLGFAAIGGLNMPLAGARPGPMVGADASVILPFMDDMFTAGTQIWFQYSEMALRRYEPTGGDILAGITILEVPMLAELSGRWRFFETFAAKASVGAGVTYVNVAGTDSTTNTNAADAWIGVLDASAGAEMKLGPGWLALEVGYYFAETRTYEGATEPILQSYSPTAVQLFAAYRFEI